MWLSVLPSCRELILGLTFKSLQGNEALSRVDGGISFFRMVAQSLDFVLSFKVIRASSEVRQERRDSLADEAGQWNHISR